MTLKAAIKVELSAAEQEAIRLGMGYARDWEGTVLAAINAAEKADVETSTFIFGLVRTAASVDAASIALEKLEGKWQEANAYKEHVRTGPKAGEERTVKPSIPASWRVTKSTVLKLARDGVALAAKADADTVFRAVKAMHLSGDDIRKMYQLEPVIGNEPMNCRADRYNGPDGLKTYRNDVRDIRGFIAKFGPDAKAGSGDSESKLPPLPDTILTALAPFQRAVRESVESKVNLELVAGIINAATEQVAKLTTARRKAAGEKLLEDQRKSAIADKRKGLELDRKEAEPAPGQAAAKAG